MTHVEQLRTLNRLVPAWQELDLAAIEEVLLARGVDDDDLAAALDCAADLAHVAPASTNGVAHTAAPPPPRPPPASAPSPPEATTPVNLDAEESVLGALMLSGAPIDDVAAILDPSDFYRESHALIYTAALNLHRRGNPVDAITVVDELAATGKLADAAPQGVDPAIRVHELAALVPAASNAPHYAQIVRDHADRRRVAAAARALDRAATGSADNVEAAATAVADALAARASRAARPLRVVPLEQFAAVDEAGADALLGADSENALIPQDGSVMFYGDGGAGKTTLVLDLCFHLAAGDAWLGIPTARPVRLLLVENEGPRPHFRTKLRRKRASWTGSPLDDRIRVLEEPWCTLTLRSATDRQALADAIHELEADAVVLGPVTAAGMLEAGTIQEVRAFAELVGHVRLLARRAVAFILVHHESKAGAVSGAWEGVGDTLLHVQGQGHGHTRLYVQKARWSSSHHATSLHLDWTDGEGFALADRPELDDDQIADLILNTVRESGGTSWNPVDKAVAGKADRKRAIRDRLLAGSRLIDAGGKGGMKLWHADDPARPSLQPELRPDGDALGTRPASGTGEN